MKLHEADKVTLTKRKSKRESDLYYALYKKVVENTNNCRICSYLDSISGQCSFNRNLSSGYFSGMSMNFRMNYCLKGIIKWSESRRKEIDKMSKEEET